MNSKTLSAIKSKNGTNLEGYMAFKRRGSVVPAKKGKGSYDRKKFKSFAKEIY